MEKHPYQTSLPLKLTFLVKAALENYFEELGDTEWLMVEKSDR